jgi:hypothetical protein
LDASSAVAADAVATAAATAAAAAAAFLLATQAPLLLFCHSLLVGPRLPCVCMRRGLPQEESMRSSPLHVS